MSTTISKRTERTANISMLLMACHFLMFPCCLLRWTYYFHLCWDTTRVALQESWFRVKNVHLMVLYSAHWLICCIKQTILAPLPLSQNKDLQVTAVSVLTASAVCMKWPYKWNLFETKSKTKKRNIESLIVLKVKVLHNNLIVWGFLTPNTVSEALWDPLRCLDTAENNGL